MLIVVQAGHAGRTSGATGAPGEQEFTIKARARTAYHLRRNGYAVRAIDADEPDDKYRGDAFVAIHADGGPPAKNGASAGYQTLEGKLLAGFWQAAYVRCGWSRSWYPDNYTDALAGYYGVRHARQNGNRAAFILEAGFITNPEDRAMFTPDMVGRSIALAVNRYFNTEDNDMDVTELRTELRSGQSRQTIKGIALGAVLDGLREPRDSDDKDVVGPLRAQMKDILREVLREEGLIQ